MIFFRVCLLDVLARVSNGDSNVTALWTDGCRAHFKSRTAIASTAVDMELRHHFFASHHGKGEHVCVCASVFMFSHARVQQDRVMATLVRSSGYSRSLL